MDLQLETMAYAFIRKGVVCKLSYQTIDLYDSALDNPATEKENNSEKHVTSTINKKFECAATHYEGLQMLSTLSSEISNEGLIKQFPFWMSKMTQILTNAHVNSIELALVCKAISNLFIICKPIAELDKRISIYHIKILVGIITEKYSAGESIHLINLLTVLLYQYPESTVRFQASFSKVISSCIDHKKSNFVVAGAKVYSLLVRALERSSLYSNKADSNYLCDSNAANCHVQHQIDLCTNLCKIMDEIFQDIIDLSSGPTELQTVKGNILQLSEIPCNDIIEYYATMENRFFNICTYLSTLLRVGGSGGKKFVLPDIILRVICRGMAIKPINIKKHNDEHHDSMMLSVLAKVQFGLLKILESLMTSFQIELVPFAKTIQSLMTQTLEWTNQIPHKSYKSVKLLVYKILSVWLKETRSLSGFQLIADEFLLHLYKDLLPSNNNLILITAKENKNRKESAKVGRTKEIQNLENSGSLSDSNIPNHADAILFLQVTSTIQTILLYSINNLTTSFYDKIRDLVILLLFEYYVKKSKSTVLKSNAECRLQLVKTLRILQTSNHVSSPCATSYAVQIFGIIISEENNTNIVEEASHGLTVLRHALNPSSPTLMILQSKLNNVANHNHLSDHVSSNDNDTLVVSPKRARIEVNST